MASASQVAGLISVLEADFRQLANDARKSEGFASFFSNADSHPEVKEAAEKLYAELTAMGIEVLFDDRKERPGVMFSDMELIGVPHTIIIGDRSMKEGNFEYKNRATGEKTPVAMTDIIEHVKAQLK